MSWCLANNIIIYPEPIDNYNLRLVIETNGRKQVGEKIYKNFGAKLLKGDEKWWEVVSKLYTYKFLKLGGVSCRAFELELEVYLVTNKRGKNVTTKI